MKKEVRACFVLATKDEKKGKKHKGLLIGKSGHNNQEKGLISFSRTKGTR